MRGRKNFYFNKFISAKDDINKTWHIIKAITNPESNKKLTLNDIIVNNAHVTDKEAISANFNAYFVHISPNLAKKMPEVYGEITHYLNGNSPIVCFF